MDQLQDHLVHLYCVLPHNHLWSFFSFLSSRVISVAMFPSGIRCWYWAKPIPSRNFPPSCKLCLGFVEREDQARKLLWANHLLIYRVEAPVASYLTVRYLILELDAFSQQLVPALLASSYLPCKFFLGSWKFYRILTIQRLCRYFMFWVVNIAESASLHLASCESSGIMKRRTMRNVLSPTST